MVCGVNSCLAELAGKELVTHDGRFNTEFVPPSFGTAVVLFGKDLVLREECLQLLGFFFTARARRETIAARGTTQGS